MDKTPNGISKSFKSLRLGSRDSVSRFVRDKRGDTRPPTLANLCLEFIGQHLEDVLIDLENISGAIPSHIKLAMCAIARRRGLLDDTVLASLADSSWEILDVSSSLVSDSGLMEAVSICKSLKSIDISCCDKITLAGVSQFLKNCKSLETLRCGGSSSCDRTARSSLSLMMPKLNDVVGESWEDLDSYEIGHCAESLRCLIWSTIDKDSLEMLAKECPRIIVNPKISQRCLTDMPLDSWVVKDISPSTWAVRVDKPRPFDISVSLGDNLSIAEKFKSAYEDREARLAPKRAKNARQHQRRAERQWAMSPEAQASGRQDKATKSWLL